MEHKVLVATKPIGKGQLDALGREEWQLITIVQWKRRFYFYFVRNPYSITAEEAYMERYGH